ncbi:MAG: hypothetical protein NWF07_10025, partial [Candidatus Bathyarchaeota archaeon]|nr:hypothetical protein [Candidatus Bathyarchaeota archaeon]
MDANKARPARYLYRLLVASLIGLGFLWTSLAYIFHSYRMLDFLDAGIADLLVYGVYYICQAVGIGFIALLFNSRPKTAGRRSVPLYVSITILICIVITEFSSMVWMIVLVGVVMNLMIGALSGCYISRLATDMPHHRRGIIFGGAYASGSVVFWLISLFMDGRLLWESAGIIAVFIPALISLILLIRLPQPPEQQRNQLLLETRFNKRLISLVIVVLFLLSMENTLGFSFSLESASINVLESTRIFYAAGLVLAGYISDLNRRWGALYCIAALVFPFIALALGDSVSSETAMWAFA